MPNLVPNIIPIKAAEYTCKQSKYPQLYTLPTRSLILGPSGTGKSVLLVNMLLDIYRGCFSKIYIFSPSIHVDKTWSPVVEYAEKHLYQKENKNEKYYFSEYDPHELQKIIDTQYKVIDWMKQNKYKELYQICIIIDDFIDQRSFTHSPASLLNTLYIRGRHLCINTICTSQSYKAISSIVRRNITDIFIFRLRNNSDLEAILDELSAVVDKKTLLEMYRMCTTKAFGFLYINLMAKDTENMFYDSLTSKLIIKNI